MVICAIILRRRVGFGILEIHNVNIIFLTCSLGLATADFRNGRSFICIADGRILIFLCGFFAIVLLVTLPPTWNIGAAELSFSWLLRPSLGSTGPNAAGLARKNVELSSVRLIIADGGKSDAGV